MRGESTKLAGWANTVALTDSKYDTPVFLDVPSVSNKDTVLHANQNSFCKTVVLHAMEIANRKNSSSDHMN